MRFVSVIAHPGHIWSDHLVIDYLRAVVIATCSREQDADSIAAALNRCVITEPAALLTEGDKQVPNDGQIDYSPAVMTTIETAVVSAVVMAKNADLPVILHFNSKTIRVEPGNNSRELINEFYEHEAVKGSACQIKR